MKKEEDTIYDNRSLTCLPEGWQYRVKLNGRGEELRVGGICIAFNNPNKISSSDAPQLRYVEEGSPKEVFVRKVWQDCQSAVSETLNSEHGQARDALEEKERDRASKVDAMICKAMP
ncbi:MAG: hypothetical protein VXW91_05725 [Pseudomonadota bacterium]|nr:hypothetical protein [Pseudomonadota bacterium]MEC8664018.1 hypothetical protein [Pseudomonadota bacterium]